MIKPFSPDDALAAKIDAIPPFVVEAVNELLARNFGGVSCIIRQNEVIDLATKIGSDKNQLPEGFVKQLFFDRKWLDFEPIYRSSGWKVQYDKPSWDENYEPYWRFERNK